MQCCDDVRKTRCLQDPEAFNIEWLRLLGNTIKEQHNTQGMYTSNVECRCQYCNNPSGDKRKSDVVTMEPTKRNSNEGENETKKHAARFETVKQERQDHKSGKTYSSGVAVRGERQLTR